MNDLRRLIRDVPNFPRAGIGFKDITPRLQDPEGLAGAVALMSQREEQIVRIRYGFYDGVARTLAQTGGLFGISRERVRQIEARALDKLRRAFEYSSGAAAPEIP